MEHESADSTHVMPAALISPEVFYTAVLLIVGWAVLLCLRAFAHQLGFQEARHNLHVQAQMIRQQQMQRQLQFQRGRADAARRAAKAKQHAQQIAAGTTVAPPPKEGEGDLPDENGPDNTRDAEVAVEEPPRKAA